MESFSFQSPLTHLLLRYALCFAFGKTGREISVILDIRPEPGLRIRSSDSLSEVTNTVHSYYWAQKSPSVHSANPGSRGPLSHRIAKA